MLPLRWSSPSIRRRPAPPAPDPLPAPPDVPVSYLSNLQERIDSSDTLNSQDQITLLFELEEGLRDGRSPTEIRDLLLRLKRRDDLLAKVATKIDAALKGLQEAAPAPRRDAAAAGAGFAAPPQRDAGPAGGTYGRSEGPKLCPHCSAPVTGSKFCGGCGAPLQAQAGSNVPAPLPLQQGQHVARSKSRRYACASSGASQLIADVTRWLDSQGFDSQQMSTEVQSVLLQVKKRGGWRDFVGMSTSLKIVFHQADDTLTVEIGAGKWIDKAAVGTVSMFILWPLAVTAGFGAWEQMKMPEKVFDFIATRLVYT